MNCDRHLNIDRMKMSPEVLHSLVENLVALLKRKGLELQGLMGKERNDQMKVVVPKLTRTERKKTLLKNRK